MKNTHFASALLVMASLLSASLFAQSNEKQVSRIVSDKGYWVVETNINRPDESQVRYYNNDHRLVHSEQVTGRKMKLNNKKELAQLKQKTDMAIAMYEQFAKTGRPVRDERK